MKLSFIAMLLPAATVAFTTPAASHDNARSSLFGARVDSSDAVQAALEASKRHGAQSPEARVAWDIVEELDSADNSVSVAMKESPPLNKAFLEYGGVLEQLRNLVRENQHKMDSMKALATEMQNIKLPVGTSNTAKSPSSPALTKALKDAKTTEEKHGKSSPEAKVAWAEVEDVAAAGRQSEALSIKSLDEECLIDQTLEACQAYEGLNRALHLAKQEQQ